MSALWTPFVEYGFLRRALAECALMGVVCGVLGVFVVLRGLTYTGESLAHTLVPGAGVALWVGLPALGGALAAGVCAAVVVALLAARREVGEDAAVGVVFSGAFAAGVILLSITGSPRQLDSLLFGDVLGVSSGDLWAGLAAAALVAAIGLPAGRRFVLVAFDRAFARASGVRPLLADAALLVVVAAALTAALRGVGALLVLALLVAPAAAARALCRRIWTMLWVAPALAVLAGVAGLEASYYAGAAAGASIALAAVALFAAAAALEALRRV